MAIAELPSWTDTADAALAPTIWPEGVRIVIWLEGEQDASTAADLAKRFADAAATGEGDVVVDLSAVRFMDAAIVTVLVTCKKLLCVQSRRLTLRAPSRNAQRILDLCGLLELLEPDPMSSQVGSAHV
jgi:anti-anti-sigma factor